MAHERAIMWRVKDPHNTGPGFYWSAHNERKGWAEGGPFETEDQATKEAKAWERDEFE